MPVNILIGKPGAGKSYEYMQGVVSELKKDHFTITSLAGIKPELVSEYVQKDVSKTLLTVHEDFFQDPKNYYHPENNPDAPIRPGARLYIDEAARVFPPGVKIHPDILYFFQKHRHYNNSEGLVPEIVLAYQTWNQVHKDIRGFVETITALKKMKHIPAWVPIIGGPKKYRLSIFEGLQRDPFTLTATAEKQTLTKRIFRKYDSKIYNLYKSAQNTGIYAEEGTGRKATIASNGGVIAIPLFIIIGYFCFSFLNSKFHFTGSSPEDFEQSAQAASTLSNKPLTDVKPLSVAPDASGLTSSSEYVGSYISNGQEIFLFKSDKGHIYTTLSDFQAVQKIGTFTKFVLKDGSLISPVIRPLTSTTKKDYANEKTLLNTPVTPST